MTRGRIVTPFAIVEATGAHLRNPQRYVDHAEPTEQDNPPLGDPSPFMTLPQCDVWRQTVREVWWLTESDRAIVEVLCIIRAKAWAGEELAMTEVNTLIRIVTALGGTPTTRQRVAITKGGPAKSKFTRKLA